MSAYISYEDLKMLILKEDKPTLTKSFHTLEKKILKEYENNNKEEIKYLKQLIKKIKNNDNSMSFSDSALGKEAMHIVEQIGKTNEEKIQLLNDLIKEKKINEIPLNFILLIQDLPLKMQTLLKKQVVAKEVGVNETKPTKSKKTQVNQLKNQLQETNKVQTKQVVSVEPFDFFVLLPFYQFTNEQSKILNEILELDDKLLPKTYSIFETFNTIVEKKHLTGKYFEYNINQSEISKKFLELEPHIQKVLFDFTKLNKRAIQKAREEMLELITIVKIIYNFKPDNHSYLAEDVIKNIIRIYSNLIKNSKNDPNIIKYLTRSIQVLEYRRKKLQQEVKNLVKDTTNKFITRETSQLIQNSPTNREIEQIIEPEDVELGEAYIDRFDQEDIELDGVFEMEESNEEIVEEYLE
jgi:hypothetical protein